MKIAVCDDSREDRGELRALLEACGYDFEIREYGSGEELYADMGYVRECGIVFLDINMEGMDGLEAAGKIKAECPKVHIVLVTAYVNYALDGYKVKASRFLLKDDLGQTLLVGVCINRLIGGNLWKFFLEVSVLIAFCMLFYRVRWKQSLFFSGLNYCLILLIDFLLVQVGSIWTSHEFMQDEAYALKFLFLALIAKMTWLSLLFILRKIWNGRNDYGGLSNREWIELGIMPLFTMIALFAMLFCYSNEKKVQVVYLFLAAGLIMVNVLVIGLMQDILEKGELLRESALTDQKRESQIAHYREMQAFFERQGRKMHDYKNQMRTMQMLLKEGDTRTAAELAERLTESISVEMSAVNTNHPVVNAVLNQKFHAAKEQRVSMIFRVGDMSGLLLDGEETVILLSNLLDNAIHECVKVVRAGRKAVINIKLVQEGGKMILSVKNPVAEKVPITDGIVLDSSGEIHGVGLMNVKAVVDKYGGDFAISCDHEKFQAVVML